jgi:hypothetical protein
MMFKTTGRENDLMHELKIIPVANKINLLYWDIRIDNANSVVISHGK